MRSPRLRALGLGLSLALPVVLMAACGGDGSGGGGEGGETATLKILTVEDVNDRVQAQKKILANFTEATGIKAELTAVAEDQLTTTLTSAAAADDLPDIIAAVPLATITQLRTDDLLDTDAAKEIVDSLGADTFAARSLELTKNGDEQLAVPSDSWPMLLYYRKDLFEKAGLQPPTTYAAIEAAAAKLDQGGTAGIVAASAPQDTFTQQTFEHLAVANGCQLTDGDAIALDSENCAETLRFYSDLIREHSVAGNQDADTTRAAYFSGRAGMILWSSFLLDELAGLRNDAMPNCPECKADKTFLVKNTGIVSNLQGPQGSEPATFGEVVSFAVLQDAATDEAKQLVEYLMGDGYEDWLKIAPEGKVPTRSGTKDAANSYLEAWQKMDSGVDTKAPLADFYDAATLKAVQGGLDGFTRWGFGQGQGELASAVGGQFIVPKALSELITSGGDPAQVAKDVAKETTTLKEELGF